jgi:hypothetical protein
MKHLIRFNEDVSNDPKVIKEYIAECFIDFIDAGAKVQLFHYDDEYTVEIMVPKHDEVIRHEQGMTVVSSRDSINKLIEKNERENEMLNDALSSIERVKVRYNLYPIFESYPTSYEFKFRL